MIEMLRWSYALVLSVLVALAIAIPASRPSAQPQLPRDTDSAPPDSIPPTFMLRACNESRYPIQVAVNARVNPEKPDQWTVSGWWTIEPDACNNILRPLKGWYYVYAEQKRRGGVIWPDPEKKRDEDRDYCVTYPGPFERIRGEPVTCEGPEHKTFWAFQHAVSDGKMSTATFKPFK